ncbi:MAG: TIGR00282 family metallophosphoesterase [Pseudomonadota bacterium]
MNILMIGDIFGRPGRELIKTLLPKIVEEERIDFVVANGENAAGGKGITKKIAEELLLLPIDVMTGGNHIWEQEDLFPILSSAPILRPYNVKENLPGRGWDLFISSNKTRIAVVCLQGLMFMDNKGAEGTSPFAAMDKVLYKIKEKKADIILVDFHAEATSEKRSMGWYLEGKVSAIVGTHTHVQTADEGILPGGTAYISDLGMTGPHHSVIGLDKDVAIHRFLTGDKKGFKVAKEGARFEGVVINIDETSGKAKSIKRIQKSSL